MKKVFLLLVVCIFLCGCRKTACNTQSLDVNAFLEKYQIEGAKIIDSYDEFVGYQIKNHYLRVWTLKSKEFNGYTFHVYETANDTNSCDGLDTDYLSVRGDAYLKSNCPKDIDCSHWQALPKLFKGLKDVEDSKRLDYRSDIIYSNSSLFDQELDNIYQVFMIDNNINSILIENENGLKIKSITKEDIKDKTKEEFKKEVVDFFQE